jgi:hypothetical protein
MEDGKHGVDGPRCEHEVEPGGRVENLGPGIGEQRLPEADRQVPEGEEAVPNRPREDDRPGIPVHVQVTIEEGLAQEGGTREQQRGQRQVNRPAAVRSQHPIGDRPDPPHRRG